MATSKKKRKGFPRPPAQKRQEIQADFNVGQITSRVRPTTWLVYSSDQEQVKTCRELGLNAPWKLPAKK
jgi:hypothetical protein